MIRDTQRTCPDCGYTTPLTSAAHAAHHLNRHSCAQQRERDRRAAAVAARKASSGEKRPCHHKNVRHEHGTRNAYVLDKCRCRPCRDATAAYHRDVERQKAYQRWEPYVDAEPARAHVLDLMRQGMGWKRICAAAGVSNGGMTKLLYGKRRPDGSRTPSKRIRPETADRLLAVRLDLADGSTVPAIGAQRRIQGLVAIGWSQAKLAKRLGWTGANLGQVVHQRDTVTVETHRAIVALYEALWNTMPPEGNQRDRIAASRARRIAKNYGWVSPLAWDDDQIDDPLAWPAEVQEEFYDVDEVDEIAIERFIGGDLEWNRLTRDERIEAAIRMDRRGHSRNDIAARTRLNSATLWAAFRAVNPDTPSNPPGSMAS